ncbi:MAG: S8 family peptidase [Lachnospiraceae bacterium]
MSVCEHPVSSDYYADFLIQYGHRTMDELFERIGTHCVEIITPQFAVAYVPLTQAQPITISRFTYFSIPTLYGLLDTTALESSGIPPVLNLPTLKADGRGVLIGMIDTGIEYTNPLFRNADGTSRILRIWDQTIESGKNEDAAETPSPSPLYGTIYTKEEIDRALASDHPYEIVPSRDTDGHGTFMAGVAAANQISQPTSFSGAAPEASLAIVKLKPAKQYLRDFYLIKEGAIAYQENDIMMGVRYLLDVAEELRLPLVIYLGLGTTQGGHIGNTPLSIQLQEISGSLGIAAVAAAGNEVGYHHHYFGSLAEAQPYDDVEIRVAQDETGFCLELWSSIPELYTVGFISPSGEVIESIPMIISNETIIDFRLDATILTINYRLAETGSRDQLIFMRFDHPSPGIWHIRVYPKLTLSRQFNMWLPLNGFLSPDTAFLRPDPDITITDPGNAAMPLTVSAYDHTINSIYIHSSRGFARDNAIRPDIAAPGVNVQGPALSSVDLPENPQFTQRSGTSVAAAIAAGAIADLFTWGLVNGNEPNLDDSNVIGMLIRGANRNPALQYPNREWGYGTLNLYESLRL